MFKDKINAFIISDLGAGGQERQLTYLIKEIKKNGGNCILIVWNDSDIDRFKTEIQSYCLDFKLFRTTDSTFRKIKQSRKFLAKYSPVTIHSFTFYLNFFCWLIVVGTKTKPIGGIRSRITLHIDSSGNFKSILSILFPKYKISNNKTFLIGLKNRLYKYFLRNTFIINNHLDIANFDFSDNHQSLINENIKTASIGRISAEKRIDLIIEIVSILVNKGYNITHYHLGSGVLKKINEERVLNLNLQKHFIFAGESSDISEFLSDKSIFIHTSDIEGYPNVIMEAMACGKPVITTNCGDVRYLVEDSINGYILPVGAADMIADKIIELITNEELREKMGHKSRTIAEEKFNLNHLLSETLNVYQKICVE